MKNLEIQSAQRTYPVSFFETVGQTVETAKKIAKPLFIIDANVRRLYGSALQELTQTFPVLEIEATEEAKTLPGVQRVVHWLSEEGANKSNHLVAIGGGIIQDIATFSAGIFFRGLPWTLIPTTLLSMADSCIGAKCGINLKTFKNQLGIFNSPYAVFICPAFLETLDAQDIKSGYGEILKLSLTAGYESFLTLQKDLEATKGVLLSANTGGHIYESLKIKKRVIEEDEYEKDLRRILNYGHTFGHALEAATDHFVPHGLAVAWGIDFMNFVSTSNGWLSLEKYQAVHQFILKYLSFQLDRNVSAETLLAAARRDKKAVSANEVNMVYFTDRNQLEIKKTETNETFTSRLGKYLEEENVFRRD